MYRGTTTVSSPAYTPPAKYGGSAPMYGSGSAPWTGSSYNDCVNREYSSIVVIFFLSFIRMCCTIWVKSFSLCPHANNEYTK